MFTFKFKFKFRHDQTHTPYIYRFKTSCDLASLFRKNRASDRPVEVPLLVSRRWRLQLENRLRSVSSQESGSVLVEEKAFGRSVLSCS
jgi:hypothetical protein